jgi:hypothetical protein
MTDEDLIAEHIRQCTASLQSQIDEAGGWPAICVFPEPRDSVEKVAFGLLIGEVQRRIGSPVKYTTQPGTA